MTPHDKRKQNLYFPESMLIEIQQEATRLDRSLSWVMQRTWKVARPDAWRRWAHCTAPCRFYAPEGEPDLARRHHEPPQIRTALLVEYTDGCTTWWDWRVVDEG